ncbi:MAG: alkaline phosphatase D family protein, partial [Gammaproteobacteria bacterium]
MGVFDRRQFLSLMFGAAGTPFVLSACRRKEGGQRVPVNRPETPNTIPTPDPIPTPDHPLPSPFTNLIVNDLRVFALSVASGDPSPSGVVFWTRIEPGSWRRNKPLYLEVAHDFNFQRVICALEIESEYITAQTDFTVLVDADGLLEPFTRYYYRFIYGNSASPVGRCKTAPGRGAFTPRLKLGVLTCQDYTNGYYGALSVLARDDSIDYIVHLGDFIYESVGDPSYQHLPFDDRKIQLPSSDFPVAMNLEDYRTLYRIYRTDARLQACLSQHTWIITRDDHEIGNDAYWDYAHHTLGLPDHPFTRDPAIENQRLLLLNQLMLDSQQAWHEYIPARVQYNPSATDPHSRLAYYRHLPLGDLVDVFMLDTRTYRTPHPCGENEVFGRYGPLFCSKWFLDENQSLLGARQFDWLIDGLGGSSALWQVLGNQTLMSPLW